MNNLVVVSKKWNNPKISMIVTDQEISFCMGLENFMQALKMELGSQNGMNEMIDSAFDRVMLGIKSESSRIMK
jgi:hypothetical protein